MRIVEKQRVAIQLAAFEQRSQRFTVERLVFWKCSAGGIEDCRNRIDELLNTGADRLIVTMPAATRAECEPVLEGIIPQRFR